MSGFRWTTIPRPSPASGVSCSVLAPVLRAPAFDLATRLCLWTAERVAGEAAAISGGAVLRGVGVQRSWTGVGGVFPGGTGHISIPPPVPAGGFKPSAPPLTESSSSSSQIDMWKQRDPGGQGPSARTLRGCGCRRSRVPGSKAGHPAGPQAPGEPAGGSRLPRRAPGRGAGGLPCGEVPGARWRWRHADPGDTGSLRGQQQAETAPAPPTEGAHRKGSLEGAKRKLRQHSWGEQRPGRGTTSRRWSDETPTEGP